MAQQAQSQLQFPVRFVPYYGDTMDLVYDENYEIFKWDEPDCVVLFSVARRGNAANIHFDCDRAALRRVREAIGEFCEHLFSELEWCTMIMGIIEKPSVVRSVKKIGFNHIGSVDNLKVYVRLREWAV